MKHAETSRAALARRASQRRQSGAGPRHRANAHLPVPPGRSPHPSTTLRSEAARRRADHQQRTAQIRLPRRWPQAVGACGAGTLISCWGLI
jgi:hypothetical protein